MSELDFTLLEKLLRMLGSEHDGEALNAARLADKLVTNSGLTWAMILADAGFGAKPAAARKEPRSTAKAAAYRQGQLVAHPAFGNGTVLRVKTPWIDRAGKTHRSILLNVDFGPLGRKRIVGHAVTPLD
jgi:hypothetical protein